MEADQDHNLFQLHNGKHKKIFNYLDKLIMTIEITGTIIITGGEPHWYWMKLNLEIILK